MRRIETTTWNRDIRDIAAIALAGLILVSCGSGRKVSEAGEEGKVPCEAYLFDTKIIRKGQQTSMRLELYQTESVLGLNGRAYLGKGALRGKLTADSLAIYLPHTNEYIYEPVVGVLTATECGLDSLHLDVARFFRTLPDSLKLDKRIRLGADRHDPKYPEYTIFVDNCQWQMDLTYDHQEAGWRILKFAFSNGTDLTLTAVRREYRSSATVKPDRLQLVHPADAKRISL